MPAVVSLATSSPPPLPTIKTTKPKATHSVSYDDIANGNDVLLHVNLELGGPEAGIIQLLQVAYDAKEKKLILPHFDEYIIPHNNAVWNDEVCCASHSLSASHPSIKNSGDLVDVWKQWVAHVENLTHGKVGIIIAWGGKGWDIEWLWKVTKEIHPGFCVMPRNFRLFLHPIVTIKHYNS